MRVKLCTNDEKNKMIFKSDWLKQNIHVGSENFRINCHVNSRNERMSDWNSMGTVVDLRFHCVIENSASSKRPSITGAVGSELES